MPAIDRSSSDCRYAGRVSLVSRGDGGGGGAQRASSARGRLQHRTEFRSGALAVAPPPSLRANALTSAQAMDAIAAQSLMQVHLRMMNSVFKMIVFSFKMMDYVLKVMNLLSLGGSSAGSPQ